LAIALVLAANASKEWDDEEPVKDEPAYEPDDGPLTEEQLDQIKASVILNSGVTNSNPADNIPVSNLFEIVEPIKCYMCGTELMNAPGIGLFCPNKLCDVKDGPFEEESILQQHPYLAKPFVSFDVKPMVAPKEELVVEDSTEILIETEKPYKELEGGYVMFEDKHYKMDALKSLRPDIFMLTADSQRTISTNFGIKFPDVATKGDVFVRVDTLPNRVHKFDGRKWIEVQKEQSDTYLHNQKYIKYLVEKIEKGEYDLDLLSETEKEQIELFLKNQK
jgi:hypothetical protein